MSSVYVSVEFSDIKDNEAMIDQVKSALMENYKIDGEEYLKKEWYAPVPTTWQEAYVREMAIDFQQWHDYERGADEKIDWTGILDEHATKEAEDKLYSAFHHLEVEVEL